MSNMFPGTELAAAREQLSERGRVGIEGIIPIDMADLAAGEIKYGQWKYNEREVGEFVANVKLPGSSSRNPNLIAVLETLGRTSASLGHIALKVDRYSVIDIIRMRPLTIGPKHTDLQILEGLVAITTVQGSSTLSVEDEARYSLIPGNAVFLDHSRELSHQAVAGNYGERIGIGFARKNPALRRKLQFGR